MPTPREETLRNLFHLECESAENADKIPTQTMLAATVQLYPSRFQRMLKSVLGFSPKKTEPAACSEIIKAELSSGTHAGFGLLATGQKKSSPAIRCSSQAAVAAISTVAAPKTCRAG